MRAIILRSLLIAALLVALDVALVAVDPYLTAAYRAVAPRAELCRILAEGLTFSLRLGVVMAFIALYVLCLRAERLPRLGVLAGTMLTQALAVEVLKRLFSRPRPLELSDRVVFYGPQWHHAHMSFPGGHATAAFALATVLAAWHPRWRWAFYAGALAVVWSRIHLDAHFVGDCFMGACLGYWIARAFLAAGGRAPRKQAGVTAEAAIPSP